MEIFPAIDLKDGQCVRLLKGDFATAHRVAKSPLEAAKGFKAQGATHVHIVDLDGSTAGKSVNLDTIKSILSVGLLAEVGGGIRTMAGLETLLEMGVSRGILGSAALKNPDFVREAIAKYGKKIAIGIDARAGMVATEGWLETADINYLDFAKSMEQLGAETIIFTDIGRDGTLKGPNLAQLSALQSAVKCNIIASGGVALIGDITALRDMGIYGAIAGKSLYSGSLDLAQAIEYAKECK